jgi:transposase
MRRKMMRETLVGLTEKLPACVVGMEACCGAHRLGQPFAACGHNVRLISPNTSVVAFANKLGRIPWAVLRRHERFAAQPTVTA